MTSYKDLGSHPLGKVALKLHAKNKYTATRLSPLILMTDPTRIPDLPNIVATLPKGSAIIYRHFGKKDHVIEAQLLREITKAQNQQLLIGGGDIDLALKIKADGVHFSRNTKLVDLREFKALHPNKLVTLAALKTGSYDGSLTFLDGLFVSSIFKSNSPSAGEPIGLKHLKQAVIKFKAPIIALGGITAQTAPKLIGSGIYGLASIDGFKT